MATLLGDVTGDGMTDVVAVIETGNTDFASSLVLVDAGAGDGTFSLAQSVDLPTNAADAEIGDLTGDGRAEIGVVGTRGSDGGETGLFVLANAAGMLGKAARYDTGSAEVVFADFNGDGSLDAVAT